MKHISSLVVLTLMVCGCTDSKRVAIKSPQELITGVWHLKDYGSENYEYSQLGFTKTGANVLSLSLLIIKAKLNLITTTILGR